jgi:hypothetical protein
MLGKNERETDPLRRAMTDKTVSGAYARYNPCICHCMLA